MKKLIVLLLIVAGCYSENFTPFELKGTYGNSDLILNFNDGLIKGESKCNSLRGTYIINMDTIEIVLGGTKVGCNGDFDRQYLNGKYTFSLSNDTLKIYGSNYIVELYSKK